MSGTIRKFAGTIPVNKLIVDTCRSSGPGGQHVNKKSTKVSVSFHLGTADWIPHETRLKMAETHKSKLSKEGYFTVRSEKTREQAQNLADCLEKLQTLIKEAERPLKPELSLEEIENQKKQLEKANAERLRSKRIESMKRRMKSVDLW